MKVTEEPKARKIVAMLFWEWRRLETEGITEEAFAAKVCFYKAYALLKDKLINSLHQMCEDFEEEGKNKDKKIRLLTELKSCEGCKYLYINQYTEFVDYCTELDIEISCSNISTFCCNRYEAKEQL